MKYYIATGMNNADKHNELRDILSVLGHKLTYDWTKSDKIKDGMFHERRHEAAREIEGVKEADMVIVIWPHGRGAHVEMGMALALDKPVVFMTQERDHHKSVGRVCMFYYAEGVQMVESIAEVIDEAQILHAELNTKVHRENLTNT